MGSGIGSNVWAVVGGRDDQSSFCLMSMPFCWKRQQTNKQERQGKTEWRNDGKDRCTNIHVLTEQSTLRQQPLLTDFAASVTKQFRIRDLFLFALRCPFTLGDWFAITRYKWDKPFVRALPNYRRIRHHFQTFALIADPPFFGVYTTFKATVAWDVFCCASDHVH
jgi:hypothetical protein